MTIVGEKGHRDLTQIRICGFGGQGVVLAGTILGHAAVKEGKWAAGSSSYGAQARGGYARSDVVISEAPIVYPHVVEADILVAMSQAAYDQYRKEMAPDGLIVFDEEMVTPAVQEGLRQIGVAATAAAMKELNSKQVANIVMIGASAALTGLAKKEALATVIREMVGERFRELNLKALEVGFRLGGQGVRNSERGTPAKKCGTGLHSERGDRRQGP